MAINANFSRNTMTQFNSNNLRSQLTNVHSDALDTLLTIIMFIILATAGLVISMMDKNDKRPVLPFTTHDTCTSTGISLSPTYGNMMRRVSSSEPIITTV